MKIKLNELRQIISDEIRSIDENMRTPEYMSMTQQANLGGSEESEVEQEVSLATLGERVILGLFESRAALEIIISDIEVMSNHHESQQLGLEMQFADNHADLSMVLDSLNQAINKMK